MKTISYLIACVMVPFFGLAQGTDSQNMKVVTEQEAHYPKGDQALYEYFYKNIKYPDAVKGKAISGEVMVSFFVEPDSTITGITVVSGLGQGIDEEVVRVLKPLKYAPAIMNGVRIRRNIMLTVPIWTGRNTQ